MVDSVSAARFLLLALYMLSLKPEVTRWPTALSCAPHTVPARVLRTFLKKPSELDPTKMRNIPIQAIGLSLYEEVSGTSVGQLGREVVRTQWLDIGSVAVAGENNQKVEEGKLAGGLLGKNVLIVVSKGKV